MSKHGAQRRVCDPLDPLVKAQVIMRSANPWCRDTLTTRTKRRACEPAPPRSETKKSLKASHPGLRLDASDFLLRRYIMARDCRLPLPLICTPYIFTFHSSLNDQGMGRGAVGGASQRTKWATWLACYVFLYPCFSRKVSMVCSLTTFTLPPYSPIECSKSRDASVLSL